MPKTKIEWCDYTINPVKGLCPMACSYCYARRMYKRFNWNPEIRYNPKVMLESATLPGGSRVFVGSTMELFGKHIKDAWLKDTFYIAKRCPWITFIFLTKQPQNLIKWSPFPGNCWVGVTATNGRMVDDAGYYLAQVEAKVKFLSIEPLLEPIHLYFGKPGIDWVLIGAQTNPYKPPEISWLREIVEATDKMGIPVFLKHNLRPLLIPEDCSKPNYLTEDIFWASEKAQLRQEMPSLRG